MPERTGGRRTARRPRALWPALAGPGVAWLVVFFAVPLYAVLAVACGRDDAAGDPQPVWNPLRWSLGRRAVPELGVPGDGFRGVWAGLGDGTFGPPALRTFVYVGIALAACCLIGYPVAYYVARHGGRRKGLLLGLLLAPFWISYLMRMLAWVNLLQPDGYVNDVLDAVPGLSGRTWLDGGPVPLVLGLIYGYVPFFILPLYAALDRLDVRLLEASRDLHAGAVRTFLHVTLPLSRQGLLAAAVITALPMFGDYYTHDLVSPSNRTTMIGNQIEAFLRQGSGQRTGAAMVVVLAAFLAVLMVYYLVSTNAAAREAR